MPETASPPPGSRRTRLLTGLSALGALTLTAGLLVATGGPAAAAPACKIDYSVNDWGSGFTGTVTVTNLGDAIANGWTVGWDFAGNQQVQQGWSATVTQSGKHVTAAGPDWAKALATGATATFGFNAAYSGTNAAPASFFASTSGPGPSPSSFDKVRFSAIERPRQSPSALRSSLSMPTP